MKSPLYVSGEVSGGTGVLAGAALLLVVGTLSFIAFSAPAAADSGHNTFGGNGEAYCKFDWGCVDPGGFVRQDATPSGPIRENPFCKNGDLYYHRLDISESCAGDAGPDTDGDGMCALSTHAQYQHNLNTDCSTENYCDEDFKNIECGDAPSAEDPDTDDDDMLQRSDYHVYGCGTVTSEGGTYPGCKPTGEEQSSGQCSNWVIDHPACNPECDTVWYQDADGDGYYDDTQTACEEPAGEGWTQTEPFFGGGDCDDSEADTYPGAAPQDSPTACMNDDDGDDYGDDFHDHPKPFGVTAGSDYCDGDASAQTREECIDCNDVRADVGPGQPEICTQPNTDNNCNGLTPAEGDSACVDECDSSSDCDASTSCGSYGSTCSESTPMYGEVCQNPSTSYSVCVRQQIGTCTRDQTGVACSVGGGTGICIDGECNVNNVNNGGGNTCDSDTRPPATAASGSDKWSNTPRTIDFSASDAACGIARTEFCTGSSCDPGSGNSGNSVTVETEGRHTIRYRSVDTAGNLEAVRSRQVNLDFTAPSVTVAATKTVSGEAYTEGWSSEPVTLNASCTDQTDLSGCTSSDRRVRIVDGPGVCPGEGDRFATATFDTYTMETVIGDEPGEEGTYWVCAGAQDRAGNVGFGGASPDARPVQVDTTDPDVSASADSPTNDTREVVSYTVNESNFNDTVSSGAGVSWSCSESDPDNDGVYEGTCEPQSDIAEGSHTVNVSATDQAGNMGWDTVSLTIDTTPPTVSCNDCDSPDPVRSGNDITFDPTVSDDTGVASIEVCEDDDGSPDCSELLCSSTTSTSCSYTTPDNTYATEDYWVRATDDAGNTASAVGPNSFTMKKWVGESCESDDACLLGTCEEDPDTGQSLCEATLIPEPGIILR